MKKKMEIKFGFFFYFKSVECPASWKENVRFPSLDFENLSDFRIGRVLQ